MRRVALLTALAVGLAPVPAIADAPNPITELRLDMCENKNPHFNGVFLRDAVHAAGFSSCADYARVRSSEELDRLASHALDGKTTAGTTTLIARGESSATAFGTTWSLAQLPGLEHAKGYSTTSTSQLHDLLDPELTTWGIASDARGTAAVAKGQGATPKEESETRTVLLSLLGVAGALGTLFFLVKAVIDFVEQNLHIQILPR
ncbi:hypothetical protein [Corynebacterium glucuronolyticum]|uniref:hypothetical protein n=1 Tax=Corynebacterium glucuronolyticum TaxID=39791 RepID=UPI00019C2098|nr:hypothetical protein [Corynebacterium glucuronolyticum]EEI27128.1 hypothetical protein HMPREF0294_1396 [Corynebacterium glucuronolyticum ATCC 51867]QRO82693.1 hypothetical protein I6J20_00380 [Corynebacterium glucuronolyticum]